MPQPGLSISAQVDVGSFDSWEKLPSPLGRGVGGEGQLSLAAISDPEIPPSPQGRGRIERPWQVDDWPFYSPYFPAQGRGRGTSRPNMLGGEDVLHSHPFSSQERGASAEDRKTISVQLCRLTKRGVRAIFSAIAVVLEKASAGWLRHVSV